MKNYCMLCHDGSPEGKFNPDIIGVCCEMKQPVCLRHSAWCVADGHGFDPLPEEINKSLLTRVTWEGNPPVATCSLHPDGIDNKCVGCAEVRQKMRSLVSRLIKSNSAPKEKG